MLIPLKTEVPIVKSKGEIDFNASLLFVGSCFTNNIGGLLKRNKFDVVSNPFGVQYNPVSISSNLRKCLNKEGIVPNELVFHESQWHSYLLHGSFSNAEKNTLIELGNEQYKRVAERIKMASHLVVTFGTAWIFELKETGAIVSNCHKIPASQFVRRRLSIDEIVSTWKNLIIELSGINPGLRFVFTVSPVRHLKDGFHENQLSKSTLLLAISQLCEQLEKQRVEYFPAYEIVLDELRDYRFYAEDMTHISSVGVNVIFEKFAESFMSEKTRRSMNEIAKIIAATEHRTVNTNNKALKQFAKSMLAKIEQFEKHHNDINFQVEKEYFSKLKISGN